MKRLQKYCDYCEEVVNLTEDGYCVGCGKHADNMNRKVEPSFIQLKWVIEVCDSKFA
jgi:hypothetical protein